MEVHFMVSDYTFPPLLKDGQSDHCILLTSGNCLLVMSLGYNTHWLSAGANCLLVKSQCYNSSHLKPCPLEGQSACQWLLYVSTRIVVSFSEKSSICCLLSLSCFFTSFVRKKTVVAISSLMIEKNLKGDLKNIEKKLHTNFTDNALLPSGSFICLKTSHLFGKVLGKLKCTSRTPKNETTKNTNSSNNQF